MNLTTNPKTHVLISFTGSHYAIDADQEIRLRNVGANDNININGSIVKGKNIAEILTMKQYYQTHPNKKPAFNNYTIKDVSLLKTINGLPKDRRRKALSSFIAGFKKHFQGREIPEKSKAVLKHFINRFEYGRRI